MAVAHAVATATPTAEVRRSPPRHAYNALVAASTPTRIAHVLGWVSRAEAATIANITIVRRLSRLTGNPTTSARLATNRLCAKAFVNALHVMIQAVIGMA